MSPHKNNLPKIKFNSQKAITLIELLIAMMLMGLVILAASSVDITSRKFFAGTEKRVWSQDEAKIAMAHMVKNIQQGIGYLGEPGFEIFDASGASTSSGIRIKIKQDDLANQNGKYDAGDPFIEYEFKGNPYYEIWFYPDATTHNTHEILAKGVLTANFEAIADNEVKITLEVLKDTGKDPSLENPKATLTSSVVLRAMSAH